MIVYYYDEWNPQHLHLGSVVEDLVDHDSLQVAVHSGDALHSTRTSEQKREGKVRSVSTFLSHLTKGLLAAGDEGRLDPPELCWKLLVG